MFIVYGGNMKKYILIIGCLLVIVGIIIVNYPEDNINTSIKTKDSLGLLLETSSGSGVYEESGLDRYPTDGYTFNASLSKCENGGKLYWDDEIKQVVFSGRASDKCYIYFDKD